MISFCKEKCHFQVVFYVIFAFTIHACSTKLSIENALRVVTKLFQFRENCTIASVRPIIINKNAMHYFVYQIRGHKNKIKIFWIWLTLNWPTLGPCTPKNCILYIAEKSGILVLGICILYINLQSEYFVCQYIVKSNLYFVYWWLFWGKMVLWNRVFWYDRPPGTGPLLWVMFQGRTFFDRLQKSFWTQSGSLVLQTSQKSLTMEGHHK